MKVRLVFAILLSLFSAWSWRKDQTEWVVPTTYRLSVIVDAGSLPRKNTPVGVAVDFQKIFRMNSIPGKLDPNSVRVVGVNTEKGHALPYRDEADGYPIPHKLTGDFPNEDAGMIWWRMADNSSTHFDIYFDSLANGTFDPPKTIGTVGIGDAFYYNDGQPGPTVAGSIDWDNDGLLDRVESGRRVWEFGRAMDERLGNVVNFYKNIGTAEHHLFGDPIMMKSDEGTYLMDKGYLNVRLDMFPTDWDEDGDPDFVGFRGNHLVLMENSGRCDHNNLWILKQPREVMELETSDFRETLPGFVEKPSFYFYSVTFADWEGDADLDMLITVGYYHVTDRVDPKRGVIPYGPFLGFYELFENIGKNQNGEWRFKKPRVILEERGLPITTSSGSFSSSIGKSIEYSDVDGDGDFDILLTDDAERPWDGPRTMWSENVGTRVKPIFIMPIYPVPSRKDDSKKPPITAQELHPMPTSFSATWVDWDGDGVLDLVTGIKRILFYRNKGSLLNPVFERPVPLEADGHPILMSNWLDPQSPEPSHWGPQGSAESCCAYLAPTVADWDGDGDLDLFVTGQRWQVQYFENVGTRTQPKLRKGREVRVDKDPFEFSWRSRIAVGDLDRDGEMEVVTTSDRDNIFYRYKLKPKQNDPNAVELYNGGPLLLEDGSQVKGSYIDANNNGDNHAELVDWDADGDLDLLNSSLYGAWYYENVGTREHPRFKARGRMKAGGQEIHTYNHAGVCTVADWNADGRLDLTMGDEKYGALLLFDRSFIENELPAAKIGIVEKR